MKHTGLAITVSALLLSTAAFAQSRGEADYDEQCRRAAPQGTAAEQAAARQKCIAEARQAARTDDRGNKAESAGARRANTKAEREAARKERRIAGAETARAPKQDPKRPDQK